MRQSLRPFRLAILFVRGYCLSGDWCWRSRRAIILRSAASFRQDRLVFRGPAVPTIQQILQQQRTERRAVGRTRINRTALLFVAGQTGVFACYVRDVTNQGAGVRLDGLNLLPTHFDLSFDNFRTIRHCSLVWRDGDFVGLKFAA